MVQQILLTQYKRIIDKLTEHISSTEGEDKLLVESLQEAGLTEDEIALVNEISLSTDHVEVNDSEVDDAD